MLWRRPRSERAPEPVPDTSQTSRPRTEEELLRHLEGLGIRSHTFRHVPVYTVEESKAFRGRIDGAHCKSLFLKDRRDQLYLVVCLEHRRLDMKRLEKAIGSGRLSFASPELLMAHLGVIPGSVTPFGLINDRDGRVQVLLDRDMMGISPLNYHPLRNDATTQIAPADLLRFLASTGHRPRAIDLETYDPPVPLD
ncbi:MAG: prolyl-tRNA synthetase associated domain-containing protein [Alphaproteobacteria bacterium]|nr:prolyl-tRNA synthetase associated domain-containing protein [Alphaproteobacteria bacterium]